MTFYEKMNILARPPKESDFVLKWKWERYHNGGALIYRHFPLHPSDKERDDDRCYWHDTIEEAIKSEADARRHNSRFDDVLESAKDLVKLIKDYIEHNSDQYH